MQESGVKHLNGERPPSQPPYPPVRETYCWAAEEPTVQGRILIPV